MKKSAFKFFIAMLSFAVFFAGCNNLFNDVKAPKTVTLKGSLALEGDAVPGEFLAMAADGAERSAVTGGSMLGGYVFALTATESNGTTPINATVTGNKFSITLDADKNYIFNLSLKPSNAASSDESLPLSISKIMFGNQEASFKSVNLTRLTDAELASTKVYFSPSTAVSGTGEIALEIDTAVEKVNYVGYSFSKSDNYGYSGSGTVAFDTNKAAINITEGAEKGAEPTPLPNGIYDFTFEFYESDPAANLEAAPTPIAITYQKVNVFAGLVTDTWISDGSAYFSVEAGKYGKFTVTQTAIDAYKYPKEFYVNGDGSNNSWRDGNDSNAGTSINKPFRTLQQAIDRVITSNDGTSEYKIYVKGTVYPKEYTTDEEGNSLTASVYKMANFNALGTEKSLNLSIIGVGSGATLSGKISSDTTADTYGSVVVIGNYNGDEPANSTKIPNLNLLLENLTIKEGSVSGTGYGGGIFNNGATVTLKNCAITENTAYYGSGIYCFNGTIITDNTTIDSNKYVDTENNYAVRYDNGINLNNSTLTVKNMLTLKNAIRVVGKSTIKGEENGATIKCDESVTAPNTVTGLGVGAIVDLGAMLNLNKTGSDAIDFKGFECGVYLKNQEDSSTINEANGHLTLNGKITDLFVELFDYGLITIGGNYNTASNISVNFSGSYNSNPDSEFFINDCNLEQKANTFEVYTHSAANDSYEYYMVTEDGKLQVATFTQAVFRAYCSKLYHDGAYDQTKMTLNLHGVTNVNADEVYKYVTSIVIPDGYKEISSSGDEGGVFAISDSESNTCLEQVTLPTSMVTIGEYAFYDCDALTNIKIPDSVKTIGDYAFNYCNAFTSIEIPNSVTSIGKEAFRGCRSVESITIPESVKEIGNMAFEGCEVIKTAEINSNEVLDCNAGSEWSVFYSCKNNLTSVIIGDAVTKIGASAFAECSKLTNVTIGKYVASIGESAFYGCSSIESITIPESVTSIEKNAFNGCTSLTSITIPESVTSIGDKAFSECSTLTTVTMLPTTPPTLGGSSVFPSSVTAIYVPAGETTVEGETVSCLEAYQCADNWSSYSIFTSSSDIR